MLPDRSINTALVHPVLIDPFEPLSSPPARFAPETRFLPAAAFTSTHSPVGICLRERSNPRDGILKTSNSMGSRLLGGTDLQVSGVGFGTVQLGQKYGPGRPDPPDEATSMRLIRHAVERGISLIDTAPGYGTEETVGKAVADLSPRPTMATKVHTTPPLSPGTPALQGKMLEMHVLDSIAKSLKALGSDSLDLVQIYMSGLSPPVPDELVDVMERLKEQGEVRHWAATTYGPQEPADVLSRGEPFGSIQLAFNILDRTLGSQIIPRCHAQGVGLLVRNVFFQGVLSPAVEKLPDRLADLRDVGRRVGAAAAEAGIPLPEMALRFAAFESQAHVTLFGTTSEIEIVANVAAFEAGPLPTDVIEALDQEFIEDERLRNPANWASLL